jgi:spermidine/putrescine transport system substrate-binding protein
VKRRTFFMGLTGLVGCTSNKRPRLNVINYSDYIGPTTIADFEKEFNVEVRYSSVIEGSEEVIAKTISGNSGWDVVFPENRLVEPMRAMSLLQPLDHKLLPNIAQLSDRFHKPVWDPNLEWNLPYLWSCCGILHQGNLPINGWNDFFSDRFRGRTTMLDEPSEVFAVCLKLLGYSINSDSEAELRKAQSLALEHKRFLRAYLNTEVRDQVAAGDFLACQLWAGSSQLTIDEAPALKFTHPVEGFSLYCDCVAILAESRRRELAHHFINYLYRPEVAASITEASRGSSPTKGAAALLPEESRKLSTLFPSEEILARGEWFQTAAGPTQRLRDRLWTEIKAA